MSDRPDLDELGPVSLALYRAAPFLEQLTGADRANVGRAINLRTRDDHVCVICGRMAFVALAVNPKTADLPPCWADLCAEHARDVYDENDGQWHHNIEPPGPKES